MKLQELFNHRVSYQVIVTFDLESADTSSYQKIRDDLSEKLELENFIYLSKDDGGGQKDLPYNTLASLWEKDSSEEDTRDYFSNKVEEAFQSEGVSGKYLIIVAQNWSVAVNEFNF